MLCLGEALVDLIEADSSAPYEFIPRLGGTVANVAVVAARAGAPVALAGAAGDDTWGRWLRAQLVSAGVDVSLFSLVGDVSTPRARVTVDAAGEPAYALEGESLGVAGIADQVNGAVRDAQALFIGSNTLVSADDRELTMHARSAALAAGRPVVFDPNLRLHRWRSRADAAASANACVPDAFLVRANAFEAAVLTGEDDPERAARALLKAGARLVVLSLGAAGAILRGELRADAPGVPVQVVSTMGAGDVFTGTLLARLALSNFYPAVIAAALGEAVAASAAACQRWGAVD
jgi:fructokinase